MLLEVNHRHQPWRSSWKMDPFEFKPLQQGQMENNDRTLKELATPDVVYQPWCIQYPQLESAQTYELKSGLIHLRGPPQASEGVLCGLLHNEVVGDIGGIHQNEGVPILPRWSSERLAHIGEILHEYWERFNKLCATCPHNQINKYLGSEGRVNLGRFQPKARESAGRIDIIGETACSSTTPTSHGSKSMWHVEHPTDMCPTLQETELDQTKNIGAIGGFQYEKQSYQNQPFDSQQHGRQLFRPGTNLGPYAAQQFRSKPNTYQRQAGYQQPTLQYQVPPFQQQQQQPREYAIPAERDRHHTRPQNANWIASRYCEPITVGRIEQPTLSNHSKFERKCSVQLPKSVEADSELNVDSQSQSETVVPLPFPSRIISARKLE
ncbi:hypothetical protein CR513_20637, partial [Mucuna pruriens]